jgi:hypothetical protein
VRPYNLTHVTVVAEETSAPSVLPKQYVPSK